MNTKQYLLTLAGGLSLVLLVFLAIPNFASANATAVLFTEDFETDGVGSRYSVSEVCNDGSGNYFTRTDGSDISSSIAYNGPSGAFFYAAQDTDASPCTLSTEVITFTAFSLAGHTEFAFTGLFAEDDASNGDEDWDDTSQVSVFVSVDGGAEQEILRFAAEGGTNSEPRQDTDFDGSGDGVPLTDTFAQFVGCFSATGTSAVIRMEIDRLDAGDEDIAFDLLQVEGDTVVPSVCTEEVNIPPAVDVTEPADGAAVVPIGANIVVTFTEAITLTGSLTLTDGTTNVSTTVVDVDNVSGLVFDPVSDLMPATRYTATLAADAVYDSANEGMRADYRFIFTTESNNNCNESLLINEIDADQDGNDDAEFVEIYDGGVGNTALDGCVLVLLNGSDDASYAAYDLDGLSTDASGYFVIGGTTMTPAPDATFDGRDNQLQNGPDAVAIYSADASDFPTDTPATTNKLISVLVYGVNDSDDTGLLNALGETTQYEENGNGDSANESLQRVQGSDIRDNDQVYVPSTPNPGTFNATATTAVAMGRYTVATSAVQALLLLSVLGLGSMTMYARRR